MRKPHAVRGQVCHKTEMIAVAALSWLASRLLQKTLHSGQVEAVENRPVMEQVRSLPTLAVAAELAVPDHQVAGAGTASGR